MTTTAFEMIFRDGTLDQYDQVVEKMGFENGIGPEHLLYHWVTQTDDGIKVVDVWDSAEEFQAFAEAQISPFTSEVGLPEPEITSYAVYNTLIGQRLAQSATV